MNQHKNGRTLIVLPAYNEEKHLKACIQSIKQAGFSEMLVIDDGSSDQTREIARKEHVNVLSHLINRGQGAAITTAFEALDQKNIDYVVTMDADGQFEANDLSEMLRPLYQDTDIDVVIGNRFGKRNKVPLRRRVYNTIAKVITYLLAGIWVQDSQSGFKAFRVVAAKQLNITANGYEFCTEMVREISRLGLHVTEVPVHVHYSKHGMKKGQNFATGLKTVLKLFIRSLIRS